MLVILGALLGVVLLFQTTRPPRTVIAPLGALDAPGPGPISGQLEPQRPPPTSPPGAGITAARSGQLSIVAHLGSYDQATAASLLEPLVTALDYVEQRTALQLAAPVTVVFEASPGCALHGVAYTDVRTIYLYACPATPPQRAINILAHEFVHQLAQDHWGAAHLRADLMLSEGFATWGAGRYWLGREADFRGFVARNYAAALLPLATDYATTSAPDAMNRLYYQWAAFVEWLIASKGRAVFDQLYGGSERRALGTAPYAAATGATLTQLESDWQAWLGGQ